MFANAEQALVGLRHGGKPTGKIRESKIVARNTKLIHFADELVGLKLHQSVIALYWPDRVTIDLRGVNSPTGNGWYTGVTLDRIDRFTPARTLRDRGLTMIVTNPNYDGGNWTKSARLYTHGCSISSSDGSFENGLDPLLERAILRTHNNFDRKVKNFAKRCVTYWRRGGEVLDCCRAAENGVAHMVGHIEANEPCYTHQIGALFDRGRQMGLIGDALANEMGKQLTADLREYKAHAINTIEPNFPYPQVNRI